MALARANYSDFVNMSNKTPLCSECKHLGTPISVEARDNTIAATYRCTHCAREWVVSAPNVADIFKKSFWRSSRTA